MVEGNFFIAAVFWQTFFRVEFCLYGGCWLKVYLCWSGWDLWSKWTLIDMGIRFLLTFKSKNMQFDTQSKLTTIIQWNVSHISLSPHRSQLLLRPKQKSYEVTLLLENSFYHRKNCVLIMPMFPDLEQIEILVLIALDGWQRYAMF